MVYDVPPSTRQATPQLQISSSKSISSLNNQKNFSLPTQFYSKIPGLLRTNWSDSHVSYLQQIPVSTFATPIKCSNEYLSDRSKVDIENVPNNRNIDEKATSIENLVKVKKPKKTVRFSDSIGKNLVEIIEYYPSVAPSYNSLGKPHLISSKLIVRNCLRNSVEFKLPIKPFGFFEQINSKFHPIVGQFYNIFYKHNNDNDEEIAKRLLDYQKQSRKNCRQTYVPKDEEEEEEKLKLIDSQLAVINRKRQGKIKGKYENQFILKFFNEFDDSLQIIPCFNQPVALDSFITQVHKNGVRLESIICSEDNSDKCSVLIGYICVHNRSYAKTVMVRYTIDDWRTFHDISAHYVNDSHHYKPDCDRFKFSLTVPIQLKEKNSINFCISFHYIDHNGYAHMCWDNNDRNNYQLKVLSTEINRK
ncbi:hypothetical protein SNEBB_003787 [Seison nebaliae]|nr:hypothetical protein SNEBB_003787 [Seison nebaliae]